MGMVSELIVSVGVEGTDAVIAALKEVDGAQVQLRDSTKQTATTTANQTQNMGMNWADFVTGVNQGMQVVNTVIGGAKKVFDFAEEGASLSALETRFDRLSESIGMTKGALLLDLRAAARGVKSDAELMQLATDMIGLGFAKTSDEAIRLASVAGALDMNMNQLALTLANQTTMRFDQLGVSIDGFDEKLAKLKATGMDTNQAFKEAFLLQAEEQIAKVGHVADSAAGSFERLHSSFSDFVNKTKKDLGEGFGKETADMFSQYFTRFNMGDAFADYKKQFSAMGISVSDLNKEWNANKNLLGWFKDEKEAANILNRMQARMDAYWNSVNGYEQPDNGQIFSLASGGLSIQEMEQMAKVQAELANVTSLTANFSSIIGLAKQFSTSLEEITKQEKIMNENGPDTKAYKDAEKAVADLKQANTDLANQMTLDMFQATIAIGGVTEAEMGAYLGMAVDFGIISQEGADAAVDAYNAAIKKINEFAIDEKTGNVVVDAAAAFATFDLIEAYAFADKTVRVMMKMGGDSGIGMGSAGPWDQAIGGPVYPGNVYNWQEPGREGEMLLPSQYGRVMSSTEVAQMLREVTRPGDGIAAGQQAQVVNNNHTEVTVQATIASDYDVDKLTREIVRRINA